MHAIAERAARRTSSTSPVTTGGTRSGRGRGWSTRRRHAGRRARAATRKQRLSAFKVPTRWCIIGSDDVPMTTTGKVDKAGLQHLFDRGDDGRIMSADRDLFLHEFIDIKGMHQWDYMEHTLQQSGDEKVDFELLGTWYTMGITARWPQVVNVWEIPGGWDGWFGKVDRLGLKRASNATSTRGGSRRSSTARAGSTGCSARCRAARTSSRSRATTCAVRCSCTRSPRCVRGPRSTTWPRCARSARRCSPSTDHQLVGLYEVLMNDYEVCTIWATSAEDHVRAGKARDVARGLARSARRAAATPASRRGTTAPAPGPSTGARSS